MDYYFVIVFAYNQKPRKKMYISNNPIAEEVYVLS